MITSSDCKVCFESTPGLHVLIETERLRIRSTSPDDVEDYVNLFGDAQVMQTFSTLDVSGATRTRKSVEETVREQWPKIWGGGDAYGPLAILKKDTGQFIGHVRISQGNGPGHASLLYLFQKQHWNKGYGKETVKAVVECYLPQTLQRGYLLNGFRITQIGAEIRSDNLASVRIVRQLGFNKAERKLRESHRCDYYFRDVSTPPSNK